MSRIRKWTKRSLIGLTGLVILLAVGVVLGLIHGTGDTRFPIQEARDIFDAIGTASPYPAAKKFVEADGAGHNDILAGVLPWSAAVTSAFDNFFASLTDPPVTSAPVQSLKTQTSP